LESHHNAAAVTSLARISVAADITIELGQRLSYKVRGFLCLDKMIGWSLLLWGL
jgi:hypothetical protein